MLTHMPKMLTNYCVPRKIRAVAHYDLAGKHVAFEVWNSKMQSKLFTTAHAAVVWLKFEAGKDKA